MASGTEDFDAIRAFIDWAQDRGLALESVSCGDVTVNLREYTLRPVAIRALDAEPDEDDDTEEEGGGRPERRGPPPDLYAAYARQMRLRQ
jgi:hypothetical protein